MKWVKETAIMGLLLVFITACSPKGEMYIEPGADSVSMVSSCASNECGMKYYLYPAVNAFRKTEIINDTYYHVFINGKYIGEWDSNRENPVNITAYQNETNTTESFYINPNDRVLLYVSARHKDKNTSFVYNEVHQSIAECASVYRFVPELKEYEKGIDYRLADEFGDSLKNNTLRPSHGDTYELLVEIKRGPFDYIGCAFPFHELLYVQAYMDGNIVKEVEPPYTEERVFEMYELSDAPDDVEFTLLFEMRTSINSTNMTCYFFDEDYFLVPETAEISKGVSDFEYNDLGQPNPSFTIKAVR